jgi:AcrR family transcriptional regulator
VSVARRIGAETSASRSSLLDAAERLMLEGGYAAVSSRRVAAAAGLKPQLVHYYFRTMDDLFVALFRRGAQRNLERQSRVLESAQPLWGLWDLALDPRGASLTMEFIALANHRKEIRTEIAASAERFRAAQVDVLERALGRHREDREGCPPVVWTVLLSSVARFLVIEREMLGMTSGHGDTVAYVESYLIRVEGARMDSAIC